MSQVRRFVVAGVDAVAGRYRGRRGLRIAPLDETGQQKGGTATCGVKRQYMGCAGRGRLSPYMYAHINSPMTSARLRQPRRL